MPGTTKKNKNGHGYLFRVEIDTLLPEKGSEIRHKPNITIYSRTAGHIAD